MRLAAARDRLSAEQEGYGLAHAFPQVRSTSQRAHDCARDACVLRCEAEDGLARHACLACLLASRTALVLVEGVWSSACRFLEQTKTGSARVCLSRCAALCKAGNLSYSGLPLARAKRRLEGGLRPDAATSRAGACRLEVVRRSRDGGGSLAHREGCGRPRRAACCVAAGRVAASGAGRERNVERARAGTQTLFFKEAMGSTCCLGVVPQNFGFAPSPSPWTTSSKEGMRPEVAACSARLVRPSPRPPAALAVPDHSNRWRWTCGK